MRFGSGAAGRRYRFLRPVKKSRDEEILERPEFNFPEDTARRKKKEEGLRLNYVRRPRTEQSLMCLLLAAAAALLFALAIFLMLRSHGNPSLTVAAIAGSSLLCSAVSVFYGILSLFEKDKNYLYSYIGLSVGGILLITWAVTVIVGRGA